MEALFIFLHDGKEPVFTKKWNSKISEHIVLEAIEKNPHEYCIPLTERIRLVSYRNACHIIWTAVLCTQSMPV